MWFPLDMFCLQSYFDLHFREIEDTILLALQSPEVYDDIARGTRCKFETNRPRAVLFEGPPGMSSTLCTIALIGACGRRCIVPSLNM